MSVLTVAVFSYLLGSLVAGVLYSRARGQDILKKDMPGGSGTFRQYGKAAAIGVTLADAAKGALAVWLASAFIPDLTWPNLTWPNLTWPNLTWPNLTWIATFFVVLGHCYPVFFRFRGGGGIAPLIGALLVAAPLTILGMVAFGLALIPIYKATLQAKIKMNAIPVVTFLSLPLGVLLALRFGGLPDLLAGSAAMALRAVQLMFWPAERETA